MNIKRIGTHTLPLPQQETLDAAGYDLRTVAPATIYPGQRLALATGFAYEIPTGMVGLVKPRSGLAVREGLNVLAGVIDSDFRGEVKAVLINHGDKPIQFRPGDRVAQLVVTHFYSCPLREVADLDDTQRGAGGFGSTGQA